MLQMQLCQCRICYMLQMLSNVIISLCVGVSQWSVKLIWTKRFYVIIMSRLSETQQWSANDKGTKDSPK